APGTTHPGRARLRHHVSPGGEEARCGVHPSGPGRPARGGGVRNIVTDHGTSTGREMTMAREGGIKNVVLVHGGFVDGSGWEGVYKILNEDGYNVTVVQNPTISLAGDVAVTKRALAAQ